MKFTRIFAFMLALCLFLSVPAPADGASGQQHRHKWKNWKVDTQPTCTEPGHASAVCDCGSHAGQDMPALGHDWSEWLPHGTYLVRICARCGLSLQKGADAPDGESPTLVLSGSQDGSTVTLAVTNEGDTDLRSVTLRMRLADAEDAEFSSDEIAPDGWDLLPAGKTLTVELDLPDVPEFPSSGAFHAAPYAEAVYTAKGISVEQDAPVLSGPWMAQIMPWAVSPAAAAPGITLSQTVKGVSPHPSGRYYAGDPVEYDLAVTNDTPHDLADVSLFEQLEPGTGLWKVLPSLPSGKTEHLTYTYVPTEDDCSNYHLYNKASAFWNDPDAGEYRTAESQMSHAGLLPAEDIPNEDPVYGDLTVTKVLTNSAADPHGRFAAGETAKFDITVTNNTDHTLSWMGVYDLHASNAASYIGSMTLKPHETKVRQFNMTLEMDDDGTYKTAFHTHFFNRAWVKYTDPETGKQRQADSNLVFVQVMPINRVTVTKKVLNTPKRTDGRFSLGEEIVFGITVTNTAPFPIDGIEMYESVDPDTCFATLSLGAGESVTLKYKYTPTPEQCQDGFLINTAKAVWIDHVNWNNEDSFRSDPVRVELTEEPLPDDAACSRSVSVEDGAAAIRTDCCPRHAALLSQNSTGPEIAWLAGIDSLYDSLAASAGAEAPAVEAARDAWHARHESLRAVCALSSDPAAADIPLQDAMLHCTELCALAHGSASSADPGELVPGSGAACTLSFASDGHGFTVTLVPCAEHASARDLPSLTGQEGASLAAAQAEWFTAYRALLGLYCEDGKADALLEAAAAMAARQVCALSAMQ